jgi:broad specificity phosphatase PhoE
MTYAGDSYDSADTWYISYIRHGENQANLTGEMSHKAVDYPLTERGVTQARELAALLAAGDPPAGIYSSPLRRAVETAEVVGRGVRVRDVVLVEELRELNVGSLDGRRDEEAWAILLEVAHAWQAGHHDRAFPGGEDYHEMTARLARGLRHALAHPPGSQVLVVGHAGLIRAGLSAICPGESMPDTNLPNCGVAELALRAGGPLGVTGTLLHWPGPAPGSA